MAILKQLVIGVSVILLAVVVTLLACMYGTFSFLGDRWYILPSGIYLAGMALIANAMNPDQA